MHNISIRKPLGLRRACYLSLVTSSLFLGGCEPASVTLLGIAAGTGVGYTLSSITYKTFAASIEDVRNAALTAFRNMGIQVDNVEKTDKGEVIRGKTENRNIEVRLEPISPKTTRIRSIARQDGSILMDRATATEVIIQTEMALVGG